jgi:hypothetical protein
MQNASDQFVSCLFLSFVNFALYRNPQTNKKCKASETKERRAVRVRFNQLCHENRSELDARSYELTNTITSQNIDFSSETSCINTPAK